MGEIFMRMKSASSNKSAGVFRRLFSSRRKDEHPIVSALAIMLAIIGLGMCVLMPLILILNSGNHPVKQHRTCGHSRMHGGMLVDQSGKVCQPENIPTWFKVEYPDKAKGTGKATGEAKESKGKRK